MIFFVPSFFDNCCGSMLPTLKAPSEPLKLLVESQRARPYLQLDSPRATADGKGLTVSIFMTKQALETKLDTRGFADKVKVR
jgi:hypothetical protein